MENKPADDNVSKSLRLASLTFFVLLSATITLILTPIHAWTEEDEEHEHRSSSFAGSLGWISIGVGVLANVPFVSYQKVKSRSVVVLGGGHEITRSLSGQYATILNFHMIMNIVGFIAGMAHGILLFRGLDAISLSLAITMTALMITGIVLRFSTKSPKNFAKWIHGQVALSALLVALVVLHVVTMTGFD
jgi:hypothetical protein